MKIFGSENEVVIFSGDDAEDREVWSDFLSEYNEMNRVAVSDDGESATLYIGRDLWPFPASIVASDAGWSFDAESAREEVLYRRIGRNELDVIELLDGYVRAQEAYRAADPDGDGVPGYASGILSTPGTRDGLYWPSEPGVPDSPIGDFLARAAADGYNVGDVDSDPDPYFGYYYRVLAKQGASAPGGAMDYAINGHMVAGHAMLAFPSNYGDTGIMSFMVGAAGVVYEADLGEDTHEIAGVIDSFDPGEAWVPVDE